MTAGGDCAGLNAAIKAVVMAAQNKNIVVIFPDTGDRYLSTPMFEEM